MPNDNFYGEAEHEPTPAAPARTTDEKPEDQEQGPTALLPKHAFPTPPEPGDVCTFRVVKVHDEEVEVAYSDEGKEGGEPEAGAEPPPPAEGSMASMMA
jgi:hypothetical protein